MPPLIDATDAHFAWLLAEAAAPDAAIRLPPGGLDRPEVLTLLRATAAEVRGALDTGAWLIAAGGEAVGLISYKAVPGPAGCVEIGFGVAASRRQRGHATAALRAVIALARRDARIAALSAECAMGNAASAAALARAGFNPDGHRDDPVDGQLLLWRLDLRTA